MTDLRTAAQQALAALEEYQAKGAPFWSCDAAVAALRAALTEPLTEERHFCPRCGKRTRDIHTCTPPHQTGGQRMKSLAPTGAQCGGLWKEDPHWGRLYKLECQDCARRVYSPDKSAGLIYPWDGHGPCPDWLPIKAVRDASMP